MKIKFETHLDFDVSKIKEIISPRPIKKALPNWFVNLKIPELPKDTPDFPFESFFRRNKTIKNCLPVNDYLQSGYIIPAWEDMFFYKDETGQIKIRTSVDGFSKPEQRDANHSAHSGNQFYEFTKTNIFNEYYGEKNLIKQDAFAVLKLLNPWNIITPKGYSSLFMRPFYHDQKINILPGIVDTDSYKNRINFPCFINIGINETYRVNLGEPIIAVFPFKRDDWNASVKFNVVDKKEGYHTKITNYYKKFARALKNYN